ncbi:MAG: hypothetical protein ACRDSR_22775 [Pseudonocardiaceae bacterium]
MISPDRTGIVAHIPGFLAEVGAWITEATYHADPDRRPGIQATPRPLRWLVAAGRALVVVIGHVLAPSWSLNARSRQG